MKSIFKHGDEKVFEKIVKPEDAASFDSGMVHPVYATFALARDIEWACRLFVLEMKDEDEEGIGTGINIEHLSPAPINTCIRIIAKVDKISKNEIICKFEVKSNGKLIAKGNQSQKILKLDVIKKIFNEK